MFADCAEDCALASKTERRPARAIARKKLFRKKLFIGWITPDQTPCHSIISQFGAAQGPAGRGNGFKDMF
jgi:hypothetical protein